MSGAGNATSIHRGIRVMLARQGRSNTNLHADVHAGGMRRLLLRRMQFSEHNAGTSTMYTIT